jgi:quercetin dioxygenase-like cupin family protein
MSAPNERKLYCLLSPELDPTNHDIACGLVEIPPGSNSDWRGHEEGEMFFCIEGAGHIRLGDEWIELRPNTAVYAPPFAPHQTVNDGGAGTMRLLFALVPPFGGDRSIIEKWKSEQNSQGGI